MLKREQVKSTGGGGTARDLIFISVSTVILAVRVSKCQFIETRL